MANLWRPGIMSRGHKKLSMRAKPGSPESRERLISLGPLNPPRILLWQPAKPTEKTRIEKRLVAGYLRTYVQDGATCSLSIPNLGPEMQVGYFLNFEKWAFLGFSERSMGFI